MIADIRKFFLSVIFIVSYPWDVGWVQIKIKYIKLPTVSGPLEGIRTYTCILYEI